MTFVGMGNLALVEPRALEMHKVFITYHHYNDQVYKDELLAMNRRHGIFIDKSVDTGDISDDLDDQTIRRTIRDDYLQDSTVTILLVGTATKGRKHVDWELYSSMIDGSVNKKSGVLVINLPSTGNTSCTIGHGQSEKTLIYPEVSSWVSVDSRQEYEKLYPFIPDRIIDNLLTSDSCISVARWEKAINPVYLQNLIKMTFEDRLRCTYDFQRPMRRINSN